MEARKRLWNGLMKHLTPKDKASGTQACPQWMRMAGSRNGTGGECSLIQHFVVLSVSEPAVDEVLAWGSVDCLPRCTDEVSYPLPL